MYPQAPVTNILFKINVLNYKQNYKKKVNFDLLRVNPKSQTVIKSKILQKVLLLLILITIQISTINSITSKTCTMKKFFTFLIALLYLQLNGQIVINEIMYNPPESNTDYLEYVELYNPSNAQINIKDYKFSEAFAMTFPDTFIPANGYILVCVNAVKFDSVFGIKAIQWTTNNLNNTSERIVLLDANGTVLDSVRYYDATNGWNPRADGEGYSLELCRSDANNSLSDFWKISNSNTGILIEGKPLYGSPGKANNVACAEHSITVSNFQFSTPNLEIFVGEFVEWKNAGGTHNINGSQNTFPNNPESFGNGAPSSSNWTYLKQFNTTGTYMYQCDPHAGQMQGTIKVNDRNNAYPNYPIAKISTTNFNGEADSINVNCQLDGTVYGVNLRNPGLQFTLIDDANDGIAVFSASKNYNYTVKEGDKISVRGRISQFQGLVQILVDTVINLGITGTLVNPTVITALNENAESQLVKINNVKLVDIAAWTKNPLGFTVSVTDGNSTYEVRIDNDINLVNMDAPSGFFNITGIGSQFDATVPYNSGYQLMPRYVNDINPYNPSGNNYTKANIGDVTLTNSQGLPEKLGSRYELNGIVHGIDLNGNIGIQFTIIDATGGITVFNNINSFGYTVKEGDAVSVLGKIDHFRGLTQIIADTVIKSSSNNNLVTAKLVTELDETTENELVEIKNLTLIDPSEWKGNGTSFNVRASNGSKEFTIRIDDNCELSSLLPATNTFHIKGLGSQFDDSEPYLDGYQILPRYGADIQWITSTENPSLSNVSLLQNPINTELVLVGELSHIEKYIITDLSGKIIKQQVMRGSKIDFDSSAGLYNLFLLGASEIIAIKFIKADF